MTPRQYVELKTNAARSASLGPSVGGIRGLGAISGPQFQDVNGNVINTIECGKPYTFNVPGYSMVQLVMTKNGINEFNGPFPVPMAPYTADCGKDPGIYHAVAFDPNSGAFLGDATMTIEPPAPGTTQAGVTSFLSGLTTTQLAVGAGLLLLLMMKGKKP